MVTRTNLNAALFRRDGLKEGARVILKEDAMLNWALIFLMVAIIAGIFGFAGLAVAAAGLAKFVFFLFLILFLLSLLTGLGRRV